MMTILSTIFIAFGNIYIKFLLTKTAVQNRIAFKNEHAINFLKEGRKQA